MNIIRTLDPELTTVNLFYKKEFYQGASNYMQIMRKYANELQLGIDFNSAKVKNDPIGAQADFFAALDSKLKNVDPQFQAYWISQFNRAADEIKNQVRLKLGQGTFFKPFSDSVGSLCKVENYLDDSTQYVRDIDSAGMISPLRYGASSINKMSPSTIQLIGEMSKKTNKVFRKNLAPIQWGLATSDQPHGFDLIPDVDSFKQMQQVVTGLYQKIQNQFKDLYNLVVYYSVYNPRSSANNLQFAPNANITVNVEGFPFNQDLLLNQLKEVTDSFTTQKVLGVK